MGKHSKSSRKRRAVLTAFEIVQTILGFGSFTIALIGLCYKLFKDDDKKIIRPHFWRSKTDYLRLN